MKYLYHVAVAPGIHYDALGEESLHLKVGDQVIVKCEHYEDIGEIAADRGEAADLEVLEKEHAQHCKGRRVEGQKLPVIQRRATIRDKSKAHENEVRAHSMQRVANQKIQQCGLDMKLINTHFAFDKSLIVFQFAAEGRVDFRELLRDLSKELHARVELRQIGVRDEAAIQGGIGTCGRPFCCATFLKNFASINVKMAKEQGLSLNPTNISGACGRLKCCLRYENDGYRDLNRMMPTLGTMCETPEGEGKIVDTYPLLQKVKVLLDPQAHRTGEFSLGDIRLKPMNRRSGGRRTDRRSDDGSRTNTEGCGGCCKDGKRR